MRYWGTFQPAIAVAAAVLIAGCGGSGGGGSDDDAPPPPRSITTHGFTITEDRSLDDNLNGIWVEESTGEYTSRYDDYYRTTLETGEDSFRQIITIIEEDGELYIRDCYDRATNIENGSKTLEFNLGHAHYVLDKQSNTLMTGDNDYANEEGDYQVEGSSEVTLFKASEGPTSRSDVLDSSLGLLHYSIRGSAEEVMNIQCLSDYTRTFTRETDGEEEGPYRSSSFSLRTFFDDYISIVHDERGEDVRTWLSLQFDESSFYAEADAPGEYVNITASGTDAVTIEIDASTDGYSFDASSDASSDAFNATAELDF